MENNKQISPQQTHYGVNELYDKYGSMLLGYISGIVNDRKLAEQYLITVFKELPVYLTEINTGAINTWCLLQRLAKQKLSGFLDDANNVIETDGIDLSIYHAHNKFLNLMTEEQRDVFCRVYYHCKTTARVAAELDKTEDQVRKTLKEVFTIIKKGV